MADGVFNVAKGSVAAYVRTANGTANSAIGLVLLQVVEADATLEDYDDLSTLLAAAGNTEATFTSYVRKWNNSPAVPTIDDVNDYVQAFITDQTWTPAGGATDNSLVKLLVVFDPDTTGGTDADIVPLTYHDFVFNTNGSNLTADEGANGFFRAA